MGISISLGRLELVALNQGQHECARSLMEEGLALHRKLGNIRGIAISLANVSMVALAEGDHDRSLREAKESLRVYVRLGDRMGIAQCLQILADVAEGQAMAEEAATLLGGAQSLYDEVGANLWPDEHVYDQLRAAAARVSVDQKAFAASWKEGRAMAQEQIVEYALQFQPAT